MTHLGPDLEDILGPDLEDILRTLNCPYINLIRMLEFLEKLTIFNTICLHIPFTMVIFNYN